MQYVSKDLPLFFSKLGPLVEKPLLLIQMLPYLAPSKGLRHYKSR